jgi:hypothetical protein
MTLPHCEKTAKSAALNSAVGQTTYFQTKEVSLTFLAHFFVQILHIDCVVVRFNHIYLAHTRRYWRRRSKHERVWLPSLVEPSTAAPRAQKDGLRDPHDDFIGESRHSICTMVRFHHENLWINIHIQ